MVPAHNLRQALHTTLDLVPVNERQHTLLFNPDPEINSLAERIVALRRYQVPEHVIRALLADVRQLLELNAAEGAGVRTVAGQLDELTTAIARAERIDTIVTADSTKKIAAKLREHLRVLRHPGEHAANAYVQADRAVRDIAASCPASRLTSPTMRNQLGKEPFKQLQTLLEVQR